MEYRELGKTGLRVSEVGFGAEWIGEMDEAALRAMVKRAHDAGVNIVDCWMADPAVRSALGKAIAPEREDWIIQGHFGSTWQDGQYVRTRDMDKVVPAFEDLLARLGTDHVELGMIHFVDEVDEYRAIMAGEFYAYVKQQLDGDDTIIRLYECYGARSDVVMTFGMTPRSVKTANLLEDALEEILLEGRTVRFPIRPYEIVTFRVSY